MRSFVIVSPGLSAGRQGQHVTAARLRMDDDQLDAFVEAGHAIEIFDDDHPRPTGRKAVAPDDVKLADLDKTRSGVQRNPKQRARKRGAAKR